MSKIRGRKKETPEKEAKPDAPGKPVDIVIPVCLGEFGLDEAKGFRRLWESIWPQDRRGKKEKK